MASSERSTAQPTRAVAVAPDTWRRDGLVAAVEAAGTPDTPVHVVPVGEATGLIWADPQRPELLPDVVHEGIDWVQLPYAGVEPFIDLLDEQRLWTCGKGVYARPVAEAALAMLLAGFRHLIGYARATEWSDPVGQNLHGAHVVVLGAGGITDELMPLLAPFDCRVTVVRRGDQPFAGADATVTLDELDEVLPTADAVVLALALTPETAGVINARRLGLMKPSTWIVNVARGGHIVTDALVDALEAGTIAGAALDVTDPEPLPAGHRLWTLPNCLITPHVGNTPEMGLVLLADRVTDNVRRYLDGSPLIGPIDLGKGY